MHDIENLLVSPSASIRDAIACIDKNAKGIALIAGKDRKLVGTITDGDIRRALLARVDLDLPASRLMELRPESRRKPLTVSVGTSKAELLHLMNAHSVRHLPVLDEQQRVVDVALLTDLAKDDNGLKLNGVVMAGGLGTRLRPLTNEVPKPMLPVGGRPLLEHIVEQLRAAGVERVSFTTHYKGTVIEDHFGDGSGFGIRIGYMQEDQPLGTAGALCLLETWEDPVLVINGDILTRLDFRAFLEFHNEHEADMTVAVRLHEMKLAYGVVETDGMNVTGIAEKPVIRNFINAGIYMLSPAVRRYVPDGRRFDMTDLISVLVAAKRRVICFPIHEYWIDVGRMEDYDTVNRKFAKQAI